MKKLQTGLITGLMAVSMMATPAFAAVNDFTVSVSAAGKYSMEPDMATINLGVESFGKSAGSTQKENRAQVQKVLSTLEASGVKKNDIKNTWYNIYPQYDYTDASQRKLTGFSASQSMTVVVRDLNKVSDLLDKLTDNGVTSINGVDYSVSKQDSAIDKAREIAVKNAATKAAKIAQLYGKKIGEVISVSESQDNGFYPTPVDATAGSEVKNSVMPGAIDVNVWVNVVYQLVK